MHCYKSVNRGEVGEAKFRKASFWIGLVLHSVGDALEHPQNISEVTGKQWPCKCYCTYGSCTGRSLRNSEMMMTYGCDCDLFGSEFLLKRKCAKWSFMRFETTRISTWVAPPSTPGAVALAPENPYEYPRWFRGLEDCVLSMCLVQDFPPNTVARNEVYLLTLPWHLTSIGQLLRRPLRKCFEESTLWVLSEVSRLLVHGLRNW